MIGEHIQCMVSYKKNLIESTKSKNNYQLIVLYFN